ncbi:carbon storage regulator [Anaerobacillus alkalidiazotrophicus]|uniref:Translational regulator CsrA n=1 Tax=Anaerobacillus alkalidiazotrophicus TaxID=472963 RepID=A0A1S2MC95_9BACI|nr:carbon storage regulator CsrA [Anaerobacillus alkalidiazotrophicus]OIJ22368.1 carbon storage regulator [Anaerobacillus alkalidiazotrophicus]
MLVLSRKKDQSIMIGDDIEITVLAIEGDQIKLGINAPRSVEIQRKEIYLAIQEENSEAANASINLLQQLTSTLQKK